MSYNVTLCRCSGDLSDVINSVMQMDMLLHFIDQLNGTRTLYNSHGNVVTQFPLNDNKKQIDFHDATSSR